MKKSHVHVGGDNANQTHNLFGEEGLSKTLDSLLEGVQIIGFDWRYLYVNETLAKHEHIPKEDLRGSSVLERHPGIEHTEVFTAIAQCMSERKVVALETQFVYPDKSTKWFELTLQPVDQGVRILSLDITQRRHDQVRMDRVRHMYAFISQINQNIVRVKDEATLFRNACSMALEFGRFKMAWIGLIDAANMKITLVDQAGIPPEDVSRFIDAAYTVDDPQGLVLKTGSYFMCNDIANSPGLPDWNKYTQTHGVSFCMVLPIRKSGNIIGTFNLYSADVDFLEKEEIDLLIEVTSDISFALDLFEKEKKHKAIEEEVLKNEKQFKSTLDRMLEGIQIHDFDWRYIYVNDALVRYSTYDRESLLGFTMMEKYPGIEQTALFDVMERCMIKRSSEHLETEFIFPSGEKRYFELSIQPIPEGIFIHSVDRTEQKKDQENLVKVNRLFAFISAINQSIVHIKDPRELLDKVCTVAVEIGKFAMAWIDFIDDQTGKITTLSKRGASDFLDAAEPHPAININDSFLKETTTGKALLTGNYSYTNDIEQQSGLPDWNIEMKRQGIKSTISLPIKKNGKVVGVFGLHSTIDHFFDEQEIILLEEASGDISFALENFDLVQKHNNAEALVINNEKRFRALIEKSADMITLVNLEGTILYASPSVTKVLGYPLDELIGQRDQIFIHPDDISAFTLLVADLTQRPGGSFSNQQRILHQNGNWVWCEGTVTNFLDQPGVMAIVSNFRDISEKKHSEMQRNFNRKNLKALINNTTDLMWSVDRNFNLITSNEPFNKMVKTMSGASIERGGNILQASFSHEQSERFKNYYVRAFTGEIFTVVEYNRLPAELWSEISFYPIRLRDKVIGTACHARDISLIKRTEQKLTKSESFNRGILNSLTAQIAVIDEDGNIVAINESWRRFAEDCGDNALLQTGVGNNYFRGCADLAENGDETATKVLLGIKDVMEERCTVFYLEYPCHTPTRQQWFVMRAVRFDSAEPMVVVSHEDITERKLGEEKLVDNNGLLQKVNAELDRFVYSASHDLRAPLCSVLGLVNLIDAECKEPETLTYASLIRTSVNRLDDFIKNILRYSKNNRLSMETVPIPLKITVTEIVESLKYMKEANGIAFEIDFEETEPFYCDLHRFTIILENVISNAIKFQDGHGSEKFIKVTGKSDRQSLFMQVEDNGIGIPETHMDKIFDMFFRVSGRRDGSGIGLYIVKETITKLHGSISVESKEHQGTTFTIVLKNLHP